MRPEPKCVIDRSRPCGSCVAVGPEECPYAYLLDPEELSTVVEAGKRYRREHATENV